MLLSPPPADLNADLGEGCGDDAALLDIVSSANIACGGHSGDDDSMQITCAAALARGVVIGAHPSYADRANFGRRPLDVAPAQLTAQVAEQLGRLRDAAMSVGARVAYVKPHGALYNAIVTDATQARAVVDAVVSTMPGAPVLGLPGSVLLTLAAEAGLPVVAEAFADRAYAADGSLVPRTVPGAVLGEDDDIAARAVTMMTHGCVTSIDGLPVALRPRSICVHGDTPGALALARRIRRAFETAGIALQAFA